MADWNVHEIVDFLVKDEALVQAKTRFARVLHIPVDSLRDFEHRYQQNSDSHSYFCEVLEKWKSMNGNATISSLTIILRKNEFVASADELSSLCNSANEPVLFSGATNKLTEWKVGEIVDLLVKDEAFVEDKQRFARVLDIPADRLTDFVHRYEQHSNSHTFFCNVLGEWKKVTGKKATLSLLENILRENTFISSADRLLHLRNSVHNPQFGVKEPVFNFVGRAKELNQLNALFTEKKSCVVLSSAMGGKGKTELCRKFIQQLPKDITTLVTWLSGDGPQQFHQSLSENSQKIDVQTTGKLLSVDKMIENISSKRKSRWVVIIDNVEEVFQDLYAAIDGFRRNGAFVVVTSRKTDIDIQKDVYIFLRDLDDEDAWALVKPSLNESQALVTELCISLQNYPLALQQAVAFIKDKRRLEDKSYGIAKCLQELNSDNSKVFDHKIPSTSYDLTLLKVYELTLSKILSVPALYLLNILSLLQPNGIEKGFLKELLSFFKLEESFDSSISILKSFSLIEVSNEEVSVHRLVQKLTRDRSKTLGLKSEISCHEVIQIVLLKLNADKLTKQEILQVIQIWSHTLSESKIVKKNSNFAVKISERLRDLSLYREMKNFSEITLQQFVTVLGPDNSDTQIMQHQLGVALEKNGEYEDALIKFQVLWEKSKEVLGEEHEETLIFASRIATVLYNLERFDDALEWHGKVLKSQVKVHGENHQFTMTTKSNMATLLYQQCKREDEALTIYKQVLEWSEKKFSPEDPHILSTRNNIAGCLYNQNKFVEAKKEFEELLKLKVKVLGEDHADTLSTKALLAATLHSLGEQEQGIEMMKQVLISQEKVLGKNHPDTNSTRDAISLWRMRLFL